MRQKWKCKLKGSFMRIKEERQNGPKYGFRKLKKTDDIKMQSRK
jgi:hypothetical protein